MIYKKNQYNLLSSTRSIVTIMCLIRIVVTEWTVAIAPADDVATGNYSERPQIKGGV